MVNAQTESINCNKLDYEIKFSVAYSVAGFNLFYNFYIICLNANFFYFSTFNMVFTNVHPM